MNHNLSKHGEQQVQRLAMHIGLMAYLIQSGAPLVLVQSQTALLRTMLSEILLLDEPAGAYVQMTQLLSPEVAEALAENYEVPDSPEGLL